MARTGNFGGFAFDEEVFTGMMQEVDYWTTPIIASGIVQQDSSIMDLIGEHGNVATIPIYKPIDANESGMEALNNDGETNNTPVEISGDKQTCMLIQRMKAFKAKDFTKELTGADPMTLIRNKIAGYYGQVWEKELMNIAQAVLAVAALSDHVLDLTKGTKTNIEAGTIYDAEQAALGDMAGGLGLMVMHSMIFKEYKKMEMVDYDKYVVNGVIQKEITLPSVKNQSIDSSGITSDYKAAISEYIWNGFEANAKKVSIEYTLNEAFGVKELIIKDNGDGINYDELGETFGAFLASKKNLLSLQIKSKANKGKGRFSFIAFSSNAEWHTVYKDNNVYKEYDINMSSDKKEVIDCSEPQLSDRRACGHFFRPLCLYSFYNLED